MKHRLRLLQLLIIAAMLATGFAAGKLATNEQRIRDAEYERVVLQVAERYQKDPSEVEVECGLTNAQGDIIR